MRVSVEMLREVFDILMRHLVETGNEEIDLEYDYYWDIPWNELNNVEVTPKDLDMGQISECIEHLDRIGLHPDYAVAYELVPLAAVLRGIGYQVGR